MAHYAFIDENNIVVEVIVGRDENDLPEGIDSWETYYGNVRGLRCLRTSYNTYRDGLPIYDESDPPEIIGYSLSESKHRTGGTPFRGTYAGIGYTYDAVNDVFVAPTIEESETT